jgi:hypothetical protein
MLRIADLLEARPALRGVRAGSWLYDPQLASVSPNLAYHRELTVPNGALTFFCLADDGNSVALAKSDTRRRLFRKGCYRPEQHVLVWERQPLFEWAWAERRTACDGRARHAAAQTASALGQTGRDGTQAYVESRYVESTAPRPEPDAAILVRH